VYGIVGIDKMTLFNEENIDERCATLVLLINITLYSLLRYILWFCLPII